MAFHWSGTRLNNLPEKGLHGMSAYKNRGSLINFVIACCGRFVLYMLRLVLKWHQDHHCL